MIDEYIKATLINYHKFWYKTIFDYIIYDAELNIINIFSALFADLLLYFNILSQNKRNDTY